VKVERPPYKPTTESITRPHLYDLKRRVDTQMTDTELKNLIEDKSGELLRNMISCEPEVETI